MVSTTHYTYNTIPLHLQLLLSTSRLPEVLSFCIISLLNKASPENMAIFSHSTSNFLLSLKLLLVSAGVLSMAVMLKLSVPVITDFAISDLLSIWSLLISWLRPPYLYVVINGIIITIVASSKLQSKVDTSYPPAPETLLHVQPEPIKSSVDVPTDNYDMAYGGVGIGDSKIELVKSTPWPVFQEYVNDPKVCREVSEFDVYGNVEASLSETKTTITTNASEEMHAADDVVISKSPWNALNRETIEFSFPTTTKPPVSARFGHRKASLEGGKTLRVSKPKRHDTLESTWKTITDGRPMPLTRHLRKSDTWEMHGRHHDGGGDQKMTKSETFNNCGSNSALARSMGSGKLKKEPSLSQDELNKRVEAFIKKFNEDMMLQRQKSLDQYMEMINRGAH